MEHSGAAMDCVSYLLVVVMELENALMVVMRLDVVSYNSMCVNLICLHSVHICYDTSHLALSLYSLAITTVNDDYPCSLYF